VRNLTSEVRNQQIEWRRTKILELSSEGYNQTEICQKLRLDKSTVNRDIQFLRQQAQDNLQKHIHEVVPEEYQKCMVRMKQNLKYVLQIGEQATDPKVKLEARRIANDCYRYIMDLCTNAGIVSDALKFVTQQEQIDILRKLDERIIAEAIKGEEEETTTNAVF
jgi:hypothetical protein